jgi:hypothetical protein
MMANKLLQHTIGLTLAVLLLTGCGGASTEPALEATPIPVTATPVPPKTTPIPATATAVPMETVTTAITQLGLEPTRIQFAPGAISAQVQGGLAAGRVDRYVLSAMAGQEMTVNLSDSSVGVNAILVIWGADGTVLMSDHADATTWVGTLPSTQDYYIDVRSVAQAPVDYVLEVIIPPATSGSRKVPPTFQPVLV